MLKNQRNDPLLVATNASNTSESPTLVLRFPPGVPSVSLRYMRAGLCILMHTMLMFRYGQLAACRVSGWRGIAGYGYRGLQFQHA